MSLLVSFYCYRAGFLILFTPNYKYKNALRQAPAYAKASAGRQGKSLRQV
ncbi:hypothetical protein HY227_01030 [Candidatus Wolfebacteria bacterium]|nr:hypothetical protein [Candidatus Wolfebacteria bacterium]